MIMLLYTHVGTIVLVLICLYLVHGPVWYPPTDMPAYVRMTIATYMLAYGIEAGSLLKDVNMLVYNSYTAINIYQILY